MSANFEKINNDKLLEMFENHDCKQDKCETCYEYMVRFAPKRLVELGLEEDPMVDEVLLDDARFADGPSI